MPFLIEPHADVVHLLRMQFADEPVALHTSSTAYAAADHLRVCAHRTVLVGGAIPENAWPELFDVLPDDSRITLWSSHPGSRIPHPPAGRRIQTDLLLGLPPLSVLVDHLRPPDTVSLTTRTRSLGRTG